MDSAEVYMLLVRPSMVPVFGEASPLEFTGQVDISNWSWTLKNELEDTRAEQAAKAYNDRSSFLEHRTTTDLRKQIQELTRDKALRVSSKSYETTQKSLDKEMDEAGNDETKKAAIRKKREEALRAFRLANEQADENLRVGLHNLEHSRAIEARQLAKENKELRTDVDELDDKIQAATKQADKMDERNRKYANFEFTFGKRVDIATTQMLNSMKAGDVFPTVVLTLHQRAAKFNHGASLIITIEKMRLLDYQLKCEISDTMTDMREEWQAEFYAMAYVYKNRGQIKREVGIGQAITAAITQGTIRTFAMDRSKMPSLPI
jgi:type VI protein secretion system component Hcp